MTLFNYKDYLRLDDVTYNDWEPFLQGQEEQATAHAKDLNPSLKASVDNSLLQRYCEEFIYLALYGEDINGNLLKMHMDRLANYEEQFRYGLGG